MESNSQYRIYLITNQVNGKRYVGKTKRTVIARYEAHLKLMRKKVNRRLYDAMNKYGAYSFVVEEFDVADSNDEANEKEAWYIHLLQTRNPERGYNMTYGGDGGDTGTRHYGISPYEWWVKKHGKEKADQIRAYAGQMAAVVMRAKNTGVPLSEITKQRIRETMIRKGIHPPPFRLSGIGHPMFGQTHSDSAKEKMSAARNGKSYEDIYGTRGAEILRIQKRVAWTGEANPRYKKIEKDELLMAILSTTRIEDAAKDLGVSHHKIISSCLEYFGEKPNVVKKNHQA